jgi:arginase
VAGLAESDPVIVYLDAHADFNHPDTAISGYFDGCALAVLTGGAWQGMLGTVPGARAVPESRVVLAGARAFDVPEEARLRDSQIMQLAAEQLRSPDPLIEAIDALQPGPSGLYLHLDLDVLDAAIAGVNVYSAPDGIDGDQLDGLVAAVTAGFPVRATSLTCYDPTFDTEGRVPPIALRVLRAIARSL